MRIISRKTWLKASAACVLLALSLFSFLNFGDGSRLLYAGVTAEDKPLRLHVLANSDSAGDQQLKLRVRDEVISFLEPLFAEAESKEQAMELLTEVMPELTAACNEFLADKADYTARLSLERTDFPEIDYDGMVFAAGEYDALREVLGEGEGHNWWCVLFPPLCFVDLAAETDEDAAAAWASSSPEEKADGMAVRWKLSRLFRK